MQGGTGADSFQSRTLIILFLFTLFFYTLLNILTSILGEFLRIQAGHKGLIFRRITTLTVKSNAEVANMKY